jgi:hypothetical protein
MVCPVADALHTPGAVVSAAEARLDDAGLIAVQGPTALDTRTGVMVGPGSTALVTGTGSTAPMQYAIAPHHWITSRGVATDGVYRGANETTQLISTTAAPGSGSRIDIIYEKQGDAASTISPDATTTPVYGVVQGASSTGTPVAPAIPVGAIELARATVAAGATATNGAGVTISQTARQTTTRGGLILLRAASELSALTTYPTLQALELDTGRRRWHDGTRWRYEGDRAVVADQTARDALTAYEGLTAFRQDTKQTEIYTAGAWAYLGGGPVVGTLTMNSLYASTIKTLQRGKRWALQGQATHTTPTFSAPANSENPLATLPAGAAPASSLTFASYCWTGAGNASVWINVKTDGSVTYIPSAALSTGMAIALNGVTWQAGV